MSATAAGAGAARSAPDTTPEAPILRRTRRRLIAWSAGSTFVVLVVLGILIYVAATQSLAAAGVAQLQARVGELAVPTFSVATRAPAPGVAITSDPSQPGLVIGGATSGTIAFVMTGVPGEPNGAVGGGYPAIPGPAIGVMEAFLPDAATEAALAAGDTVIQETSIGDAPVRVMAATVQTPNGALTTVVIGDRTAELDTLRTLLVVLLGGGLAVLAASVAVGYVYAGRALIPIRDSLERQREFAADASHELRTPLAITRVAVAELRRGRRDPAVVDRAIEDIDAGTTRMERLVDDLLLLARTDADAIELVVTDTDLAHVAAGTAETLEPVAAARGVRLTMTLAPAPLRADEARLRQLTGILLDNAIRHSPDGGRVTVSAGPGAWLRVEDEGAGIAPEDLDRVFERFWRAADAPSGGTGLGLAIASWIAERHGGSVTAENRTDRSGARFTVRLPGA